MLALIGAFVVLDNIARVASRGHVDIVANCAESFPALRPQLSPDRPSFALGKLATELRVAARSATINLVGDSVMRGIYLDVVSVLTDRPHQRAPLVGEKHQDLQDQVDDVKLRFYWRPYISNLTTWLQEQSGVLSGCTGPDGAVSVVVLGAGLWDLLYMWDEAQFQRRSELLGHALAISRERRRDLILWKSTSALLESSLTGHRKEAAQFRNSNVLQMNQHLQQVMDKAHVPVLDGFSASAARKALTTDDGVHNPYTEFAFARSLLVTLKCILDHHVCAHPA